MTEMEFIELLTEHWPRNRESDEPTPETIAACDKAVTEYPNSAKLWVIRGCLLQLADFDTGYQLNESAKSFSNAIKAEPYNPEAYEELGYFLDAVMDKPRKARQYFRKAFLLKRARAQQGTPADRKTAARFSVG